MSKKLICLTAVGLMLAIAGSAGAQVGKGNILFEYWENIGSGTAITDLTNNALYPNKPTSSEWRTIFESPVNRSDNAGMRAQALLTPPADGDYTFYIATDDAGELWLSTDATPANAKKIAFVAGWAGVDDWQNATEKANQKSAAITLKASQNYYIMGLEKEGGGGDNLDVGWTGPVIGNTITSIAGKYCTAIIRTPEPLMKAQSPVPANGAVEITNPLFTWTPGVTAVLHDVYVGTSATLGTKDFMMTMPTAMYFQVMGLTPGTTYYWRVDEIDAAGAKTTGDVWSFTAQPLTAHNPSPYDGALWRKTAQTLTWTAGQGAAKHRPYIGTDKAAVTTGAASVVKADQTAASLAVSGLTANSTYYWRVDEIDSTGKVSAAGPVWSFSTIDAAGGAIAEYFNNTTLSGAPAKVTTVPEVNFSWPSSTVKGTGSPDPAIQVDNFSARFTANLNVPVSGKYTLYCVADDGARLFLNGTAITGDFSTSGTSAALDLVAGQSYVLVMESYELTGAATAQLSWSGPGIAKDIVPQGALQIPQVAISANPSNNAVEVPDKAVLSWTAGPKAVVHTLYFGTDKAKVTASDKSVALPPSATASYTPPALLTWNTTYYWKVDEMGSDGVNVPGLVWSFTTANWVVVNAAQATLNYDDTVDPYMSQLAFDVTGDLTRGGVTDLALRFTGQVSSPGSVVYTDANGVYTVTGAGADIWGNADAFQYVYKTLTGDGSMIARVTNIGPGANTWAKGGVMIRQSLAAGSTHATMALSANTDGSAGNGYSFQRRLVADGASTSEDGAAPALKPPYWVQIARKGNLFTASISPDGKTWKVQGTPQTIVMTDPVFIGLAVTSHVDAATKRTVTFDSVSTTGTVVPAGPFSATKDIGIVSNDPAPLYVAIQDKAGKMAMVANTNPAAVNTTVWDLWRIPMSAFAGVDLKNAKTLYIGVGNGKPAGTGIMNFSDVRILMPVVAPDPKAADVTAKGDPIKGFPNYSGAWPAAETPDLAIDNSVATKYLNFANSGGTNGKTSGSTGFSVTPSVGATVVTGLTFTSANDTPARDPIAWQLVGSNGTIDGPWETIASGVIDDFSRSIDWPRNWKGVTPIGFANTLPFLSYKVTFTALHIPSGANSMQIAEVELLGVAAAVTAKANPIITKVVRAGGYTETRDPIGVHDGATAPLPMGLGGLLDGNMVYSDRTYPFNQTPASMAGIEYIRIIQSDKNVNTVSYTVTLSRAATIVLAHDDRNAPTQAAVDMVTAAFAKAGTFKDTGIDVFVYESATVPTRPYSVFTADFPAGTYVFAAEPSANAMYIIGAK